MSGQVGPQQHTTGGRVLRVAVAHACPRTRQVILDELGADPAFDAFVPTSCAEPLDAGVLLLDATGVNRLDAVHGANPLLPVVLLETTHGEPGEAPDSHELVRALIGARAALDVVPLPSARTADDALALVAVEGAVRTRLVPLLRALGVARMPVARCTPLPGPLTPTSLLNTWSLQAPFRLLALASGRGSLAALASIVAGLPRDLPVPVVAGQHLPARHLPALVDVLDAICPLPVRLLPGAGVRLRDLPAGTVWVTAGAAPVDSPAEGLLDGVLDGLLGSAARGYAEGVLTVVLAGIGRDGVRGATAVREAGGTVLAQDEESSLLWSLPGAVALAGQADRLVPLSDLAAALTVTLAVPLDEWDDARGRHARLDPVGGRR